MTPQDITSVLTELFGNAVQVAEPDAWQVEVNNLRVLVLLSEDQSWLRSLVSIASSTDAQPYFQQLLEANFDETQEVRYALHQGVLWGVFHHSLATLTQEDFREAIARLIALQQKGLNNQFTQLAETQIRQIIRAAKQQGQSLETTLKSLERLYREGVMGEMDASSQNTNQALEAWRYQLERLWQEET